MPPLESPQRRRMLPIQVPRGITGSCRPASIPGNLDLSWGRIKNTPWDASQQGRNKLAPAAYFALAELSLS